MCGVSKKPGTKFTLVWLQHHALLHYTTSSDHFSLSYRNVLKLSLWMSSTSYQFLHHISLLLKNQMDRHCCRKLTLIFPVSSAFIKLCFNLPAFMAIRTKVCFYDIKSSAFYFFFLSNPSLIIFWMLFTTNFGLWKHFSNLTDVAEKLYERLATCWK